MADNGGTGGLIAQPLGPSGRINYIYLILLVVNVILAVFFLFYFNRLFATILSYLIRAYTWHKYHAYIDITSLQISVLGGRIFFKTIRYHGHNQTIYIHDGRLTWRYWLHKVREAQVFHEHPGSDADEPVHTRENDTDSPPSRSDSTGPSETDQSALKPKPGRELPSRLHLRVSGVEVFLYNRTPIYDDLLSAYRSAQNGQVSSEAGSPSDDPSKPLSQVNNDGPAHDEKSFRFKLRPPQRPTDPQPEPMSPPLPTYLRSLPVQIECKKAAVAVGNEHTASVIVAKAERANGTIDAAKAGPLDIYKTLFMFDVTGVTVSLKPNVDFKHAQHEAAANFSETNELWPKKRRRRLLLRLKRMLDVIRSSCLRVVRFCTGSGAPKLRRRSSVSIRHNATVPGGISHHEPEVDWHGLARFLDDDEVRDASDPTHADEYARLSLLADCSAVSFKLYWDIPGMMPLISADPSEPPPPPPDYGVDITLHGGTANYGPWADRQRIVLQNIFFPPSFTDYQRNTPPSPGQARYPTSFRLTTTLDQNFTLRIPFREPSKDWMYRDKPQRDSGATKQSRTSQRKKKARLSSKKIASQPDVRPFAWIDLVVKKASAIHYTVDQAGLTGEFVNSLQVDLTGTEVSTSVNHDFLLTTDELSISGDLSAPLAWNALRSWTFDIDCHALNLYILRDHMFLVTDLVSDWSTGPPVDYHTMVPFRYGLKLSLHHSTLTLNTNDANVIDNPTSGAENNFLLLKIAHLRAALGIHLDAYRPTTSCIPFDVVGTDLSLELQNPPRETFHHFLKEKKLAVLPRITLKGQHTYFIEQSSALCDVLKMRIEGDSLRLTLFGILMRHLINVKENYFGDFVHYRTSQELQRPSADLPSAVDEEHERYKFRPSNDLDVLLDIVVKDPVISFPTRLYAPGEPLQLSVPIANVDLRVTNYYLDLQLDVAPVKLSIPLNSPGEPDGTLSMDGFVLQGHRLFGLPPIEPAYISTWNVNIARLTGTISAPAISNLLEAGKAFAFTFKDDENAVPLVAVLPEPDLVFLRLSTAGVQIELPMKDHRLGFFTDPFVLELDDAPTSLVESSRLTTYLSNIKLICASNDTLRHHDGAMLRLAETECEIAFQTSINIALWLSNGSPIDRHRRQQLFLKTQDSRAHRAAFLTTPGSVDADRLSVATTEPPTMFVPSLPEPVSASLHGRSHLTQSLDKLQLRDDMNADESPTSSSASRSATSRVTLLVDCEPSIQGRIDSSVIEALLNLTEDLEPTDAEGILDTFQMSVLQTLKEKSQVYRDTRPTVDIRILVPVLDLKVLVSPTPSQFQEPLPSHEVDLSLQQIAFSARFDPTRDIVSSSSAANIHLGLDSLSLNASATGKDGQAHELFRLDGERALLWSLLSAESTVHVSLDVLTAAVPSENLASLVSLVTRCTVIARNASTFEKRQSDRSLCLVKNLIQAINKKRAPVDTPQLGRLPYVLRVDPDHVRNRESWRMLVRIRHSLRSIPAHDVYNLHLKAARQSQDSSPDDGRELLESWAPWCTWDVPDPADTQVYRSMFRTFNFGEDHQGGHSLLVVHTGTVRLTLETAETHAGDIFITEHITQVSMFPPKKSAILVSSDEMLRTIVMIHSTVGAVLVNLRWALLEFVEPLFRALSVNMDATTTAPPRKPAMTRSQTISSERICEIQSVAHVGNVTVAVNTPHVHFATSADQLQASVLNITPLRSGMSNSLTAVMSSDSYRLDLIGGSHHISSVEVVTPNVFVASSRIIGNDTGELDVGVNYRKLNIKFEQEPLALESLLIRVVHLEVAQVLDLIGRLPRNQLQTHDVKPFAVEAPDVNVKAVLLAGPYSAEIALFNGLKHIIHGQACNLQVCSRPNDSIVLDMTLEPVAYWIISPISTRSKRDTTITMPAVGLSAKLAFGAGKITALGSIDITKANIEAAVLYNLLVMLRDAGIADWLTAVKRGWKNVQRHANQVQPPAARHQSDLDEIKSHETGKTLVYDLQVQSAGLSIVGQSPLPGDTPGIVKLLVGLDPILVSVKSKRTPDFSKAPLPDVILQISGLYAKLQAINKGQQPRSCGSARIGLLVRLIPDEVKSGRGPTGSVLEAKSDGLNVETSFATAPYLVALITHIDQRVSALNLGDEIRRLRRIKIRKHRGQGHTLDDDVGSQQIPSITAIRSRGNVPSVALRIDHIRISLLAEHQQTQDPVPHELELTVQRIDLRTRRTEFVRLAISDTQLKLSSHTSKRAGRPVISASLPEVSLDASLDHKDDGWLISFNATGQTLGLDVHSLCFGALSTLRSSSRMAMEQYRLGSAKWRVFQAQRDTGVSPRAAQSFNAGKVHGLKVHVKFAGAALRLRCASRYPQHGISHQQEVVVKAPGVAINVEYAKCLQKTREPSIYMDVQVQASANRVTPELVPFIAQMVGSIKREMQRERNKSSDAEAPTRRRDNEATSFLSNSSVLGANAVFAKTRVSFGLRIGRQEFELDCQPLARIKTNMRVDDIYITAHTIEGMAGDRLFSASVSFSRLSSSISHMYSRAATASFGMDSLNVSVMSDKHSGSATTSLLISVLMEPIQATVNARQIQDVLIFRDVWRPEQEPDGDQHDDDADDAGDEHLIQRYRKMANAATFPWDVIIALEAVDFDVDFGQSIGKHKILIKDLWARSTKNMESRQVLCVGLERASIHCHGRMGGIFELDDIRIRASIQWPVASGGPEQTPLITANGSFERLRLKASFDFQPFAFADVNKFSMQMFNVKSGEDIGTDRLVAVLDGNQIFAFCTATSPSQALGLFQAFARLVREKSAAYTSAKREMMLESKHNGAARSARVVAKRSTDNTDVPVGRYGISLRSRVTVTFGQISLGAFPNTFVDNQILKFEASDVLAEAIIGPEQSKIHSDLRLRLGQLQVALASVKRLGVNTSLAEVTLDEVIKHGIGAKGGIILRVPRVVASMQSWQKPEARQVEFIFKSTFEGKVDVGWNYARIAFIRSMWNTHTRSLAARMGKPLQSSVMEITASPDGKKGSGRKGGNGEGDAKITAIINMPAARYEYHALVEPVIETPQLRDMGEATPPLEWIGLNRERLPSLVHQVVITALLNVAREVEGAYGRILRGHTDAFGGDGRLKDRVV